VSVNSVFVHRTVERGRIKCGQYWPADDESIEQYGNFAVVNNGLTIHDDYCVTSLLLQNLEVDLIEVVSC
jgi:tyrosine-protein phosphatase non-receptor type 9